MAFKEVVEKRGSISNAMRSVGYTTATAKNPRNLTLSKGWQELLGSIVSDEILLDRTYEIVLQEDKRASLQAIDMLLRLKDRYPTNKLKIGPYEEEVSKVLG